MTRYPPLLCALALALALPLASRPALANTLDASGFGATIANGRTTFYFVIPGPADNEIGTAYSVFLNWCVAKDSLPANWSTQPDKTLRTSSMCKTAPAHSNRGKRFLGEPPGEGKKEVTISGALRGRYILSVTLWTGYGHTHDGGYHTALGVFTPSEKSPPNRIPGLAPQL